MKKIKLLLLAIVLPILITACMPKAPDLDQKTYMFSVAQPKPFSKTNDATLEINETNVISAYADTAFVYRTSDVTYTKDYYNIFFIPANQQIHELLINNFQETNLFTNVSSTGALVSTFYILKSNITGLYADYRNLKQPKAVLTMDIALYKQNKDHSTLLFQHTYNQSALIQPANSKGLVLAWSRDLTQILTQVMQQVDIAVKHDIATKK